MCNRQGRPTTAVNAHSLFSWCGEENHLQENFKHRVHNDKTCKELCPMKFDEETLSWLEVPWDSAWDVAIVLSQLQRNISVEHSTRAKTQYWGQMCCRRNVWLFSFHQNFACVIVVGGNTDAKYWTAHDVKKGPWIWEFGLIMGAVIIMEFYGSRDCVVKMAGTLVRRRGCSTDRWVGWRWPWGTLEEYNDHGGQERKIMNEKSSVCPLVCSSRRLGVRE